MIQPNPSAGLNHEDNNRGLIDLHIAEYNALTARCTSLITLQYAALTVILVYLTVVATLWHSFTDRRLLYWGSVLILQAIGLFWIQTQGAQYTAILYVEKVLRPALSQVVHMSQFWCYEPFLAHIRKTRQPVPSDRPEFFEIPIPSVATVIVLLTFVQALRSNGSKPLLGLGGWLGLILNVFFLVLLWKITIEVRKIRLAFSKKALESGCNLGGTGLPSS